MNRKMVLLHIGYWVGAIIDGIMVVPMLFPKVGGAMFGIDQFDPGVEYRYAMMVGASLMFGWTVLLIWADRKPVERKGVILLTIVVVVGMLLANLFAVSVGLVGLGRMIPLWSVQTFVLILYGYNYSVASRMRSEIE